MDESQRQAPKTGKINVSFGWKLLTGIFLAMIAGGGSALSSGPQLPESHSVHVDSSCLLGHPAESRGLHACMAGLAEPYRDLNFPSSAVVALRSPEPVSIEDDPIRSMQIAYLDGSRVCLGLNVYWEARNQNLAGQLAVAQVTMNRVNDPRYPNDVCKVVYDHKQFSWYWDGKSDRPRDKRAWEKAMMVASAALHGSGHVELQGVTHYHAVYIQPYWKNYMTMITMIGDHIFYTE